ncbi:MAG: rRNA (cytidine-2'-O-)-methyltransferase, partial [Candidatus Marinimicrobia bacterium]|nr:rRNA (cytidine-2'-O-)-methyltransferase [Candidatus Neomarinimicrobiota bacterium]
MAESVGKLYIVSTPIGNLGDMTYRAVELLKNVPMIAAEDTRHSRILMSHYDISTPLISYYEHNRFTRIP